MLTEDFRVDAATPQQIVAVIRPLLLGGDHVLGQFQDRDVREWPGGAKDQLTRLEVELSALGRAPGLGEVAWIAKR